MRYETAGEPTSNLKWTKKTTQKIADELAELDIKVSKTTVGKILKNLGFSLKTRKIGDRPRFKYLKAIKTMVCPLFLES